MCANEPHSFKNVRKCAATELPSQDKAFIRDMLKQRSKTPLAPELGMGFGYIMTSALSKLKIGNI